MRLGRGIARGVIEGGSLPGNQDSSNSHCEEICWRGSQLGVVRGRTFGGCERQWRGSVFWRYNPSGYQVNGLKNEAELFGGKKTGQRDISPVVEVG